MRGRTLAAAALVAGSLSGCGGLEFRQDHRLSFVGPGDLQKVALPMTLSWTMKDYSGTYAVFVDQAPIKVGQTLRALFTGASSCGTDAACPTPVQLHTKDIYVTDATTLSIDRVGVLPAGTGRKIHTLTVVLLDPSGRRDSEAAWERDVEIPSSQVSSS